MGSMRGFVLRAGMVIPVSNGLKRPKIVVNQPAARYDTI